MQAVKIQDWFESREEERKAFLAATPWSNAELRPVGEDCAFRRYFRMEAGNKTAILMEAVPDDSPMATPGHRLGDFVKIGKAMHDIGLHTPQIYQADREAGYLLLEDFGDLSFKKAMSDDSVEQGTLYGLAVDALSFIRENMDVTSLGLPAYYDSHVHEGRRRLVDWYMPALLGKKNEEGLVESYLAVWQEIESALPPCPQGFLHIDYHVENLMWLPQEQGLQRAGILDFQGAMTGPLPYDLANLLEDARHAIDDDLRQDMVARYCAHMDAQESEMFRSWYRILATQFHCRVAGQFIRLAVLEGKTRYLQHLPRLASYLDIALDQPVLAPLKSWCAENKITFSQVPEINPEQVKNHILDDAF